MTMTVSELAEKLEGVLEGDGSTEIKGLGALKSSVEGDVSFLSSSRYLSSVATTKASAVIVSESFEGNAPCPLIIVKNPDSAFALAAQYIGPSPIEYDAGIHKTAVIASDAKIGKDVSIGPFCVIEPGVEIGENTVLVAGVYIGHDSTVGEACLLYPNVSVRERIKIGDRVAIHNGAVIGSDGFGYVREEGQWSKIPQIGVVEIGDDCEIGANVTIDRARFGVTRLGKGVKLDNLVQVAHNVQIGDNTAMAAQSGISGSATVGKDVQIAGQAGVVGHMDVGDGAIIGGQAGVTKNVSAGAYVTGYPAMPHDKAAKMRAHMKRLPELKKKVSDMEKRIKELE